MQFLQVITALAALVIGARAQSDGDSCGTVDQFTCNRQWTAVLRCTEALEWKIQNVCDGGCGVTQEPPYVGCLSLPGR
jgi:hypothetical protein